ncbi:MAG: FHA domain-containing protein [Deltaproteobacteria bacterium]|nr:MAG: FHA domain-containing protein [Deltaproteobacteria bacterium]
MRPIDIRSPDGETLRRELLPGRTLVGRLHDCDLVLAQKQVSRRHAAITLRDDGAVIVEDLGSQNGTYVNGRRIAAPTEVGPEDSIQIGDFTLRVGAERLQPDLPWQESGDLRLPQVALVDGAQVSAGGVNQEVITDNPILGRLRALGALGGGPPAAGEAELAPGDDPLALFLRISDLLATAPSLQHFLDQVLGLLMALTRSEAGAIVLEDPEGQVTPMAACTSGRREGTEVPLSRSIVRAAIEARGVVATHDATHDARFGARESVNLQNLRSVLCAPLFTEAGAAGAVYLTRPPGGYTETEQETVAAIAHLSAMQIERARLRERTQQQEQLRRALSRFHAPEVVERVIAQQAAQGEVRSHLEEAVATVLFADMVGFTALAEALPPERLGALLNDFYRTLTKVVFDLGGTVDKYIGDCVMALFGVPISRPDDTLRAVDAAVRMRRRFEALCETRYPDLPLALRIGINTGSVVAGTVGSELRLEYTALGDAVNVAQRLEAAADPGQILVGPETYEAVKDYFDVRPMGAMKVRGRRGSVEAYAVQDAPDRPLPTHPGT